MTKRFQCGKCRTRFNSESGRMPSGWHAHQNKHFCGDCWNGMFVMRAITFPVRGVVAGESVDFYKAMDVALEESVRLANWCATELRRRDVIVKPRDKKLAPMPAIYLYGLAKKLYPWWGRWEGNAVCACSLMRRVERCYRKKRLDLMWFSSCSLPTYRSVPFPFHNQSWTAAMSDGNEPTVNIPLGGKRWTIRLAGGAEYRRQLASFKQIISGEAIQQEACILTVPAKGGDNRSEFKGTRAMFKMAAWFPKKESEGRDHTLLVKTDPNALWVAEKEERRVWILNGDEARQKHMAHKVYLQRVAEDTKFEKRWPKEKRKQINENREARCRKHGNWMDTYTHQVTAMLAKFAERQKCAEVMYDDSDTSFLTAFPWFQLRTKLAYKLDAVGIRLIHCGASNAKG